MPEVPGIGPLHKFDLAYQLRLDPTTLLHFLRGNRLSPWGNSVFRKLANGHWSVSDFRRALKMFLCVLGKNPFFTLATNIQALALVNAYDQSIKSASSGDEAAAKFTNSCALLVRYLIQAPERSPDS